MEEQETEFSSTEISSLENDLVEDDSAKTTVLTNMHIIAEDNEHILQEGETIIYNSDGNLEINTIEEEVVYHDEEMQEIQEIHDLQQMEMEEEEDVQDDTEEVYEEVEEETYEGEEEVQENYETEKDDSQDDDYLPPNVCKSEAKGRSPRSSRVKKEKVEDEANPCTLCQRSFKTPASLKRHITVCHAAEIEVDDPLAFELCYCCGEPLDSAHTSGEFKCDSCEKLFALESSMERHRSIEHVDDDVWKCHECSEVADSKEQLIKHFQVHPLKSFSCSQCNREFTRKYHLDRHIGQIGCDGNPKNEFTCQVCAKVFSRKDNLRAHLRAHAGQVKKKKMFTCEYCSKVFHGSALLQVHLRTHTGERPYPCDMCPKRFPSSGAMKKHRRMHTGERPYECSQCQNRFAAKETLNRHMRIHTGDKPHACQFCGKTFIQAAQLRAHIFHHTGENAFTCPHCNRAFNRRARLTTHIKFIHEGAKPMECPDCDRTFFRKEDLARHAILHSGVKPFECDVCHKSFAVKSSLKLHLLTHRKEQPCSCDECGRAFIRQDCLLRHMRAKHRDVLENIMASAEKKRLQQQLLHVASEAAAGNKSSLTENRIWNELTLTDSIKELLTLLVDDECLKEFGWPDTPVDKILDAVIRKCGHAPASEEDFDYIGRMRENAKLLFTVVIDDEPVKALLNNQTVDEVILHVLRLAKNDD